jgi:hypothetical protein
MPCLWQRCKTQMQRTSPLFGGSTGKSAFSYYNGMNPYITFDGPIMENDEKLINLERDILNMRKMIARIVPVKVLIGQRKRKAETPLDNEDE